MRYIVNSDNSVVAVSFGSDVIYNDCLCTEYTGSVPENYSSLEEWCLEEELTLWRWKIVDGNLVLDPDAVAPEEGKWGVPELQSKTVTPTTSSQTVKADEGYDGLEKVTVNKIPSSYVKPNATRGETTITPGKDDQYIGSGVYCSGLQTIEGDSDLVENNIKNGVKIFGVTGSYKGNPRIAQLSGTPLSLNGSTGKLRLTTNTADLVGFAFASIYNASANDATDTADVLYSGFVDVKNKNGLFTTVRNDGKTTSWANASLELTITSSYIEIGNSYPFAVVFGDKSQYRVVAVYTA